MKIKYEFATGEVTEVKIEDSIGAVIIDSRREEDSAEREHRRHCYSIDAITYEGNGTGGYRRIAGRCSECCSGYTLLGSLGDC